ncbi:Rieske 2Fe-2S domain-containing protein [Saccharopolyspora tripterygii]
MTERSYACEVDDLDDGDTMTVELDGEPVALYRVGDEFFATADT